MGIKNTRNNVVESFFIQHSLPRFPLKRTNFFDKNIKNRAQHFVCVSMRDDFSGQNGTNQKLIKIDTVEHCNFFKLLWHYARNVNAYFVPYDIYFERLAQFSAFREILLSLPNFPISRAVDDRGVPSQKELTSFTIESTGTEENKITFQIFAKAPNYNLDIYDDVTALFSIHHDDYNDDVEIEHLKTANWGGKTAMLMIAQSHSDPATLGINEKTLVDREKFFATVHILNSGSIKLKTENGRIERNESMYRDHSKWSVNMVYGVQGDFPPLLCFYDLNRSTKQALRGGGAFCLNSSVAGSSRASLALWELFMSFYPDPTNMARFNNADVKVILDKVLPRKSIPDSKPAPVLSPFPEIRAMKEKCRSYSSGKRRHSIEGVVPLSASRPANFSRAIFDGEEIDDDAATFKISHKHSHELTSVPCPYKFRNAKSKLEKSENVDSKTIQSIARAVDRYGFTKLNKALFEYKLQFSVAESAPPASFQSPEFPRTNILHSCNYTKGDVLYNSEEPFSAKCGGGSKDSNKRARPESILMDREIQAEVPNNFFHLHCPSQRIDSGISVDDGIIYQADLGDDSLLSFCKKRHQETDPGNDELFSDTEGNYNLLSICGSRFDAGKITSPINDGPEGYESNSSFYQSLFDAEQEIDPFYDETEDDVHFSSSSESP